MMFKRAFKTKFKTHNFLILGLLLLVAFYIVAYLFEQRNTEEQVARRFQQNFLNQEETILEKLPEIKLILQGPEKDFWPKLERLLNKEEIYCRIYSGDSLIFWNSNHISTDIENAGKKEKTSVIFTKTGWYLTVSLAFKAYNVHLFKQIKSEFEVSNPYLPVQVSKDFSHHNNIEISFDTVSAGNIIRKRDGKAVLGISVTQPSSLSEQCIILLFSLFIIVYLVFLLWIDSLYAKLSMAFRHTWLPRSFFVLDVIILRLLDFYLGFPSVLKTSFLFEQYQGGIPFFSSMGDILLNSILLLFIVHKLFRVADKNWAEKDNEISGPKSVLYLGWLWAFSLVIFYLIFHTVKLTPYSSHFGLLFESHNGIFLVLSIVVLMISMFIVVLASKRYVLPTKGLLTTVSMFLLVLAVTVYFGFNGSAFLLIVTTVFVELMLLVLFFDRKNSSFSTEKHLLLLVIFAFATAWVVNRSEMEIKDRHQTKAIAFLGQSHEPLLEKAYENISDNIIHDTVIQRIVFGENKNRDPLLDTYLREKYFVAFWEKYDIQLTLCSPGEDLEIQPENILVNCDDYFSGLIEDFGEQTAADGLYLLNLDPESIYYIGEVEFDSIKDSTLPLRLHIEFFYSVIPKGLGYPELLVDKKFSDVDLAAYSFARYHGDKLVYKFGNFPYHTDYRYLKDFPDLNFFSFLKYRHYKLNISPENILVLSRPNTLITENISTFSILFIAFSLVFFVFLLFLYGSRPDAMFRINFQKRLQFVFTGSIAFIILLLAIITMYYVEANSKKNLTDQLNEKTYSVLIELQHKLGGETSLETCDKEELFHLLRKFSMVFFSDINLYSTSGRLIASSRPEIFQKGLLSEYINPQAFEELFVDDRLFYLTEEKIGTLAYYSSYVPLILNDDKPSGIINLPYFARQNEVRKSYHQMLFTFVNLFVILGILGVFIGLTLSKLFTRPLKVLQTSLANIRIDKQNEKLKWNKNDEIGQLIEEYNRMVDKLEQSADLLRHSERESTWREVARQIAHEIKNPLTPMKLNVQYLEKAYRENDPGLDEKVKDICSSLVTQIETLNNVAEMFADFSKKHSRDLEKIDLLAVISSSVELFRNNQDVRITVTSKNEHPLTFAPTVDGSDILRVFNNLLKNSIQSLAGTTGGEITISLETRTPWHVVTVADNGKGIDEQMKNLIFQPYFTTKTGGTGLGLAIAKSIMTEIGGSIEFESRVGRGTVFTLKFKAVE